MVFCSFFSSSNIYWAPTNAKNHPDPSNTRMKEVVFQCKLTTSPTSSEPLEGIDGVPAYGGGASIVPVGW